MTNRFVRICCCQILVAVLYGCLVEPPKLTEFDPALAGPDGFGYRKVVDERGKPFAAAWVSFSRITDSIILDEQWAATRSDGYLPKLGMDDGWYSAYFRSADGLSGGLIDSIRINGGSLPSGIDTLRKFATVRGPTSGYLRERITTGLAWCSIGRTERSLPIGTVASN